jgi:hypothetical protein
MTTATFERSTSRVAGQTEAIGTYTASFGIALGLTGLFNGLLVVLKETNPDTVLAWMKAASGHHWATHGILDIVVFGALGLLLAPIGARWRAHPNWVAATAIGGVVAGSLIIVGFFLPQLVAAGH